MILLSSLFNQRKLRATGVHHAKKPLGTVTFMKVKKIEKGRSIFVAVDDADTPYLIFSSYCVKNVKKNGTGLGVSFHLQAKDNMPYTIEFAESTDAETFYNSNFGQ